MIGIFTQNDWSLLARLITAHLIAEWSFKLSFLKSVESNEKCFSKTNLKQGATAGGISFALAGSVSSIWLIFVIFIFRVLINCWEYKNNNMIQNSPIIDKNKIIPQHIFFILKHSVYLLVILVCWGVLEINLEDITGNLISVVSNGRLWFVSLGYILLIWPIGSLIGKITEPWRKELLQENKEETGKLRQWTGHLELKIADSLINKPEKTKKPKPDEIEKNGRWVGSMEGDLLEPFQKNDKQASLEGLAKAGLWLGRLERILILTFVLISKYEAIGFLITAKSIFRFSEIKCSRDRKEAEYFLIGTMLSFVFALVIGIFTGWILKELTPSKPPLFFLPIFTGIH